MKVKNRGRDARKKEMGSIGKRTKKKVVGRGELKKNVKRRCRQEKRFRE